MHSQRKVTLKLGGTGKKFELSFYGFMVYNVSGTKGDVPGSQERSQNRFDATKLNNHPKPLPSQYVNVNHLELTDKMKYKIQKLIFLILNQNRMMIYLT